MSEHESAMERLRRLRGVSWEWADPGHPSHRPGRQMGVIAQELREVFPDLVREGPDGYLAVDYAGLLAPVIEALKEPTPGSRRSRGGSHPGREDRPPGPRPEGDHRFPHRITKEQIMSVETRIRRTVQGEGGR